MEVDCEHWKEYDSIGGPVCFCDIAAFGNKLTAQELQIIGCTAEKRKVCNTVMEVNVGAAVVPQAASPPVIPNSCDPPKTVAVNTVGIAEKKATSPLFNLLILGFLAGCYIALAGALSTVITNDLAKFVGDGMSRLMSGMVFSLGLILVVLGGAELFTGNTLMVTAWFEGKINGRQLARNWTIVYLANFLGSIILAWLFYNSGIWKLNDAMVGVKALLTANAKINLTWTEALVRGILCNWLVCLAVWLASASKDGVSKILSIVFPVTAFVACGFEHSIANMYFIPAAIFVKSQAAALTAAAPALNTTSAGVAAVLANLNWSSLLFKNLIPVTIGNVIGGAFFVGAFYWSVFLRPERKNSRVSLNLASAILARITSFTS